MKLALIRVMLFKADILLLDEPTNHLDVVNVAWLKSYLTGLKNCTLIIVSQDSGFLNNTITDVLHLNRFKVRWYCGNLKAFVKAVPEAKSYYTLEAAENYKFKLPDPPLLEGVKTREKSPLKMCKVGFQYLPFTTCPATLRYYASSLTLIMCCRPRPNRSGKSTLVKLLIGDMEANKGVTSLNMPSTTIAAVVGFSFASHHVDISTTSTRPWRGTPHLAKMDCCRAYQ
ncbi:hypothetical protein BU17DRAFT_86243 [Hysterangium stoloniferum]|nr:hypothetical protein BU17DRAFT_86243 [Hysterangium stoloniferum]